jgi:hypothetical protein
MAAASCPASCSCRPRELLLRLVVLLQPLDGRRQLLGRHGHDVDGAGDRVPQPAILAQGAAAAHELDTHTAAELLPRLDRDDAHLPRLSDVGPAARRAVEASHLDDA